MDRKAWIVVTTCSILLILNLWISGKNNAEYQKAQAEKAKQEAAAKQTPGLDASPQSGNGADPDASDAPSEKDKGTEESTNIETSKAVFNLSNISGGIAYTEFKEELSVYDPELNVRMNDQGLHRIGALTTLSGETLDEFYYDLNESTENSATYFGGTRNGLDVLKIWSKAPLDEKGADYRLRLTLKVKNSTQGAISLGQMALATGSSAPLYEDERSNYQNFFWQEAGEYDSEDASYFKDGFFSKAKTEYREAKPEGIDFSGVENQFFATIIDPAESYLATMRSVPKLVELPASRGNFRTQVINTYLTLPDEILEPGKSREMIFDVFVGPKENALLRSLEGGKGEVMNYGIWPFSLISRMLNTTLNFLAKTFGTPGNNWAWGWAVVALTIIIRALMWPLHAKSTRTMKRMSQLQPKMAALKEKYPDNPNKMNQEMMKLYKEFGVNPMGGCVPMLFQIPVFFGFFTMLQYAVELRNQPFLGWVKDLSQPDTVAHIAGLPINVLPILMAITMVLQMRMTPQTGDKMQRRIFMFMPVIFFFFCYNFASALALYWTTQNIFSIGQTWLMQKMPEPTLKKNKKAGKKSWMQKLAEKAEEAQKMQKQGKRPQSQASQEQKSKKPRGPRTGG